MLPPHILTAIRETMELLEADIQDRIRNGDRYPDLEKLKNELIEITNETRQIRSYEAGRMIIDSMDWDNPTVKKFNELTDLLRKHYRVRL